MDNKDVQVTVPVPVDRVSNFYRWFADWREGGAEAPQVREITVAEASTGPFPHTYASDHLVAKAVDWWGRLNQDERNVWRLWINASPELVSDQEMVEKVGLKNTGSIRGKINRVEGKGRLAGFPVGWQSDRVDPISGHRMYGLRDMNIYDYDPKPGITKEEYAAILRKMLETVGEV
ncbi:hypothetical protein [Rathayibacter soli]|uniref:hypothetical protein n=1 Tax=Rathayibacter soli TaxID=3144168 RepID=UPI0027E3ED3D|nr:hypothetical protein [Glaciibacter superstes]